MHDRTNPCGHDPSEAVCSPDVRMNKIKSARQAMLLGEAYIDRTIDQTVERIHRELDSMCHD